mgnify:CR=1 FL=1
MPSGSDLDRNQAVAVDQRAVDLYRNHAGGLDHRAGADVEGAVVEIALDDVAADAAFGQRTRPVGAGVVGDVEFAVEVEYGKDQTVLLDPYRATRGDLCAAAQRNAPTSLRLTIDGGE